MGKLQEFGKKYSTYRERAQEYKLETTKKRVELGKYKVELAQQRATIRKAKPPSILARKPVPRRTTTYRRPAPVRYATVRRKRPTRQAPIRYYVEHQPPRPAKRRKKAKARQPQNDLRKLIGG